MLRRRLLAVVSLGLLTTVCWWLLLDRAPSDSADRPSANEVASGPDQPTPSVCWSVDCLARLLLQLPRAAAKVPPIRHLLLPSNGSLSSAEAAALQSWRLLHPSWTICLWTEETIAQTVGRFFPKYRGVVTGSFEAKSRVFRFLIVQKYGGMFLSANTKLKMSAEPLRKLGAVFLVERSVGWKPRAVGEFFMATPGHPFVQFSSDRLLHLGSRSAPDLLLLQLLQEYGKNFPTAARPELSVLVANTSAESELQLSTVAGRACQHSATCTEPQAFHRSFLDAATFGSGIVRVESPSSPIAADSVRVASLQKQPQLRISLGHPVHAIRR